MEKIDPIENGESGGSIRHKLNALIDAANIPESLPLSRSLARIGDYGQTLHADFVTGAYGLGSRLSGGIVRAVSIDEMFTIQRASTKHVWQPTGPDGELALTEVSPDMLAREWNPVTGEPLGTLIERAATNLMPDSNNFGASASWVLKGVTAKQDPTVLGMRGPLTRITEDTSKSWHDVKFKFPPLEATALTISFTCLPTKERPVIFYLTSFDEGSIGGGLIINAKGEMGGSGLSAAAATRIVALPSGAYRVEIQTHVPSKAGLTPTLYLRINQAVEGDGTSYVHLGEVQVEAGNASSYIPTDGAPATRDQDLVYRHLGNEINKLAGTFIARAVVDAFPSVNKGIFEVRPEKGAGRYRCFIGPDGKLTTQVYGIENSGTNVSTPFTAKQKVPFTIALSCDWVAGIALAAEGGTVGLPSDISKLTPFQPAYLMLGMLALGGAMHNDIRLLDTTYFPYAMTKAQLEALTA